MQLGQRAMDRDASFFFTYAAFESTNCISSATPFFSVSACALSSSEALALSSALEALFCVARSICATAELIWEIPSLCSLEAVAISGTSPPTWRTLLTISSSSVATLSPISAPRALLLIESVIGVWAVHG